MYDCEAVYIQGLRTVLEALRKSQKFCMTISSSTLDIHEFGFRRSPNFMKDRAINVFVPIVPSASDIMPLLFDQLNDYFRNVESLQQRDKGEIDLNLSTKYHPCCRCTDGVIEDVLPLAFQKL